MAELLLELLSEEIPARMQDRAQEDLRSLLTRVLDDELLRYSDVSTFATARRLTVVVSNLQLEQFERTVERRGPREDAPEQARKGFLGTLRGMDYELSTVEDRKGRLLIARIREDGRSTADILAAKLPESLTKFRWPKSMRWGSGDFRWVRPLHSVLCLFDGRVVPFEVGDVRSGDATRGHRFLAPEPFAVRDFADYVVRLREAKVILDGAERREIIAREAEKLAASDGLAVADDPALLDELKGLVEWPVPLLGVIDEPFMELPPEVLVSTMRNNQKYLALRTQDGALAPRFVLVANTVASDGGAAIVAGNERVLRARLWDARFFWDQDRRHPLESRLPALDKMVFHAELGSLGERVQRLVALSGALTPHVPGADRSLAERAARLAKADLVTGMVGEFPELQGVMGGYYARAQGEPEPVAAAIRDHYAPKGPDDSCPTAPESVVVALADKLDALAGFFSAGIKPTGSKDPFALRRAALGVIRIVVENQLRFNLRQAFLDALYGYGGRRGMPMEGNTADELMDFIADRLIAHLRERSARHDLVAAVLGKRAAYYRDNDLVRILSRIEAMEAFLDSEDGGNMLFAYRRASSIVEIEEKKDGCRYNQQPSFDLLQLPEEKALFNRLKIAQKEIGRAIDADNFQQAMAELAWLRQPLDGFFKAVMVNVPEPALRENRLLLLNQVRSALERVADFSLVKDAAPASV